MIGKFKIEFHQVFFWVIVLIWIAGIFYFSSKTAPESNAQSGEVIRVVAEVTVPDFRELPPRQQESFIKTWQHTVRKSAHVLSFFTLGILSSLATMQYGWSRKKRIGISLGIPYGYAVLDEIHQLFVSGRAFMYTDIGIDIAAASVGVLIVFIIAGRWVEPIFCEIKTR